MEDKEKYDILLLENLSHFKEETANCSNFAEQLSAGIDIFVNDAFSLSHKILASTVGIGRFCYACIAGFHFEEALHQLKEAIETNKKPYIAIVHLSLSLSLLHICIYVCIFTACNCTSHESYGLSLLTPTISCH